MTPRHRRPDETVEEYNAVMKDPETGKWNLPPMGSFDPFGSPLLRNQEKARGYDEDHERKWREYFGTGQERTNLDAPQTGLSAAQINLKPGFKGNRVTPGMFGSAIDFMTGKVSQKTNNPAEVAGLGSLVSDPGGSMYGTDSSSALSDYMLPQEDMTSTLNWSTELQEKYPWIKESQGTYGSFANTWIGENRPPRPFSLEEQNSIETMLERFKADKEANEQRAAYAEEHDVPFKDYIGLPSNFRAGKLNENIPGNIYAKHGGSVFKTAYDQASNIMYRAEGGKAMSGGLSNLRESIDINGQPHKLAYINPDEASLLKAMGGSGRKVNGVPAYFWGGMGEGDWSEGDTSASAGNTGTAGGEPEIQVEQVETPTERAWADQENREAAELADAGKTYSWADEITPKALNEAMGTVWQGMDQTHAQHMARLTKEGYEDWEYTYLNSLMAQGMSFAEAQSALASALASGKGMALQEAFTSGYSYGGPAGTLQGMFEDIALGYSNQLKEVLNPLTKDRKEGIEGLLANLKGTNIKEMQEAIGKWTKGKENINFNPYTGDMHSIIGGLISLLPGAGLPQFAGRLLGQNPIGTITIDGKEYTVTASGDIVAETGPVNTAGPFENRRTRRLPTIMKDVIKKDEEEEEEEEKKSIADLVGPGEDLVESLSLQNLRDLLQGIYGPNYEPFGEEA